MPVGKQGFACIQGILGCRQCGSDAVKEYSNDDERFHGVSPKKKGKHRSSKGKCFPCWVKKNHAEALNRFFI